jgi:hypothetical protein
MKTFRHTYYGEQTHARCCGNESIVRTRVCRYLPTGESHVVNPCISGVNFFDDKISILSLSDDSSVNTTKTQLTA